MSTIWYPPGMEIYVDNPGYGELVVVAPITPYQGKSLIKQGWGIEPQEWHRELYGPQIGEFLDKVTDRALSVDEKRPGHITLPSFLTEPVARTILPALQRATILATAGTDKFDRTYHPDPDEAPHAPLCVRCGFGTYYTPGAMQSDWCDQHGHKAYGTATGRWETAQEMHDMAYARWERDLARRRHDRDIAAIAAGAAVDLDNERRERRQSGE